MPEPIFDDVDIQASIAPGFRLPHQALVVVSGQTAAIRAIVGGLRSSVTTMDKAQAYHSRRIARAKELRVFGRQSFGRGAGGAHLRWLNIALGPRPLADSGFNAPARFDRSFDLGLPARSRTLGDPPTPATPGHPDGWKVGRPGQSLDLLLLLGSDDKETLARFVAATEQACVAQGGAILYSEAGARLEGDKEHFGFRDGISQPGLRGVVGEGGPPLTPRRLPPGGSAMQPEFAAPGEVLIWPGEVLFGYPRQDPNDYRQPLAPSGAEDPFLRNGSYLVFRRLRQNVQAFDVATAAMAQALRAFPEFAATDDAWLRAHLIGRWPSGAPLQAYPQGDPGDPPGSLDAFNNVLFHHATQAVTLASGEPVAGVAADPDGLVCPLHAHVRKVNPRDSTTNLGGATHTQQLRILRRGIPYGPPVLDRTLDDGADRGLIFLSFQRSIREQFEKLSQDWMNSALKPEADRGHDVLVGHVPAGPGDRRAVFTRAPAGPFRPVATNAAWIAPTGGGYFFCPSVAALALFAASSPVVA